MNELLNNPAYRKCASVAPWLTLVVLIGLSQLLPNRAATGAAAAERKAEIAATLANTPFFIGAWVGEDKTDEVPPEAQKLLRPNAILSRAYTRPGWPRVHVLVVHCSDARDMIGHYPPVCYPSAGWMQVETGVGDSDVKISVGDEPEDRLPFRLYQFRQMQDAGIETRIRIFGAFVLPDGTVTRDIADINRQSERRAVSVQGVAQVQIITPASASEDVAIEAASQVFGGMSDLLDALRVSQRSES